MSVIGAFVLGRTILGTGIKIGEALGIGGKSSRCSALGFPVAPNTTHCVSELPGFDLSVYNAVSGYPAYLQINKAQIQTSSSLWSRYEGIYGMNRANPFNLRPGDQKFDRSITVQGYTVKDGRALKATGLAGVTAKVKGLNKYIIPILGVIGLVFGIFFLMRKK